MRSVTFPGEAAQADGEAHGNGEEGEEDEVDGVPLPEYVLSTSLFVWK